MLNIENEEKRRAVNRRIEFQAVVLCGYGHRLEPLVQKKSAPKALLPLANKPMLHYILKWFEDAGIHDIILVVQDNGQKKIRHFLDKQTDSPLHVDMAVVNDEYMGPADVIRSIRDKIKYDFIVVGCDLITNMIPHTILDFHRLQSPAVTSLYFEKNFKTELPTSKAVDIDLPDYVGLDPMTSQLCYLKSREDIGSTLSLSRTLLCKSTRLIIRKNLFDAHLFIFKRWVLDLIVQRPQLSSISHDLVPYLIKCQNSEKFFEKEGICQFIPEYTDYSNEVCESNNKGGVQVCIYIFKEGFCNRVNNIANFYDSSRYLTRMSPSLIHESAETNNSTIGPESLVGENTVMQERCSLKKSSVGKHCKFGTGVKLVNSIVMDYVTIGDGVRIDNSIISSGCIIKDKEVIHNMEYAPNCKIGFA